MLDMHSCCLWSAICVKTEVPNSYFFFLLNFWDNVSYFGGFSALAFKCNMSRPFVLSQTLIGIQTLSETTQIILQAHPDLEAKVDTNPDLEGWVEPWQSFLVRIFFFLLRRVHLKYMEAKTKLFNQISCVRIGTFTLLLVCVVSDLRKCDQPSPLGVCPIWLKFVPTHGVWSVVHIPLQL